MNKPLITHDVELDALQDALHDAFAAYWRDRESPHAEQLWAAYCALEEQMDEAFSRAKSSGYPQCRQ